MAIVDSGSCFPSRQRHGPDFVATYIVHLSRAQHCKPTFPCWVRLHLQSWCDSMDAPKSNAPFSYQFWNIVSSIIGYAVPLALLFGSQKGFLQPQLAPISYLVLLGPYLLLLSVQILTELLTWHWKSPVWLVTPAVYEAYPVLQLMRGLKLSAEISAPAWMVHTIRGLVCWWVLILGLQLMRVAWFAGFSAKSCQMQT